MPKIQQGRITPGTGKITFTTTRIVPADSTTSATSATRPPAVTAVATSPSVAGPPGTAGSVGTPGSVWRDGDGPPSDTVGIDGDFYLNGTTGEVYKRTAGTYAIICNIKGDSGAGDFLPLTGGTITGNLIVETVGTTVTLDENGGSLIGKTWVIAGEGTTADEGGGVSLIGGASVSNIGGTASLLGADGGTDGGDVVVRSGNSTGGGDGGDLFMSSGDANPGSGAGGHITIAAGSNIFGTGDGGRISLSGGQSDTGLGGDIKLAIGGSNSGTSGNLLLVGVPTSDPAVLNAMWLDNGVLVQSGSTAGVQGTPGPSFYDLVGYWRGQLPSDTDAIHYFEIARAITLPATLLGSIARCLIAPTGAVTLNLIQRLAGNPGTPIAIGSINFASGATNGTFTFTNQVTFAVGDVWEVDPPNPQDATFAGLSWTIVAEVI